jgi:hypothetical protein
MDSNCFHDGFDFLFLNCSWIHWPLRVRAALRAEAERLAGPRLRAPDRAAAERARVEAAAEPSLRRTRIRAFARTREGLVPSRPF